MYIRDGFENNKVEKDFEKTDADFNC